MRYIVARGAHGQATLQHMLREDYGTLTFCGRDVSAWSRAFMPAEIPAIICLGCKRKRA